eukprot:TRINITY_DN3300_c0_g1_i5.p1 TRINITY_DN3300_c0_g1~~TRINITY_DN3300_c0_g1_i5.p1  ORF type:complete len:594 (+),score=128.70 TRINITY_DN3300_c0_g1_i5:106-1782(+)
MKGTNIALGPMVNIARVPVGGRNFESFGEDPYLSSQMVVPQVLGIQENGIMACVKHWAANNQEYHRRTVSENVDERTLHEIYFPAFKAAIDAGVASLMCSYNKVNNVYACENEYTLNTVLKNAWGYKGFVMSDWGATHSTVLAANSGLDMQMPDDSFFGAPLAAAVQAGNVTRARLDDMVLRILTSMFSVGIFDTPQTGDLGVDSRSPEHTKLAREIAAKATVLVKNNDQLLPISPKYKTIAVIGDVGEKAPIIAGGGSGHVNADSLVTPFAGISARAGENVKVVYAPSSPVADAVKLASAADIAIVFVGTTSHEGTDRSDLSLGNGQDELVAAVAAVQNNTVVVVHTPGAVLMPWEPSVPSILVGFMPGQEDGHAIADVLFGDVNPSGKLPVTFPLTNQLPFTSTAQYPGINDQADYSEKLLVGYRWYDANKATPLYPFGHGLSYTEFQYYGLQVQTSGPNTTVTFTVQNTGLVPGTDFPQIYVGFPASAGEPLKQLRGFQKVSLKPGETTQVNFLLTPEALSIWDSKWTPVPGNFDFWVGSSSRDVRLQGGFTLKI